jgi:hypothetical protein
MFAMIISKDLTINGRIGVDSYDARLQDEIMTVEFLM